MNAMTRLVDGLLDSCNADFNRNGDRNIWDAQVHGETIRVRGCLDEVAVQVLTGSSMTTRYEIRFAAPDSRLSAPAHVVVAAINAAIQCMGQPVYPRWQDR